MSIWYDGSNLNMYRGDSGTLIFTGLPSCIGYRIYFSVKSIKSGEIIFEVSSDPEYYYVDNDGVVIEREEGETEEEYIARCEALVAEHEAVKCAKCTIFLSSENTEKLSVLKTEKINEYYYGLKMCFAETGVENTLIPLTRYDEETKQYIFYDPPKLIVRPKYTEGIQTCDNYEDIETESKNPKSYGLQPLLVETDTIKIEKDNRISVSPELISKINDLKQTVGNNESGLVKNVNDINNIINSYGNIVTHNTDEFQEVLTPGLGIDITDNNISVNIGIENLNNVLIENLQDGDILVYNQELGKWVNRQLP